MRKRSVIISVKKVRELRGHVPMQDSIYHLPHLCFSLSPSSFLPPVSLAFPFPHLPIPYLSLPLSQSSFFSLPSSLLPFLPLLPPPLSFSVCTG